MAHRSEVPHSARRILDPGRCKGESTELFDKVKAGINLIRSCRKLQCGLLVLTEYACLECKYITQLILKIQKKGWRRPPPASNRAARSTCKHMAQTDWSIIDPVLVRLPWWYGILFPQPFIERTGVRSFWLAFAGMRLAEGRGVLPRW
jgi:hypothetical protein